MSMPSSDTPQRSLSHAPKTSAEWHKLAGELRISILDMLTKAKSGHPGGSLSCIDIIASLWFDVMQGVDGKTFPTGDNRDRFVLSKGHGVPALYSVFVKKGWITREEMMTLRQTGSRLQGHPDRNRLPIVEASTGSLGQGLSVAQGMAMAMRLDRNPHTVFCVMGDGEIQEGQIWEAALSAPKYKLSNLVAIIDNNKGQIDGPVSEVMSLAPLAEKWSAFGWDVSEIDGHDFSALTNRLKIAKKNAERPGKPQLIIADTIKGKGVSFMEGKIEWHGVAPKAEENERAQAEIKSKYLNKE